MTAELLSVLDSVGPSAQFCTDGNRPPVLPGLIVKGLGEIGVPVSAADARRLIAKAAQAPYGRGEETIVDTTVRRVWQLEPRQLAITNPAWEPFVASVVEAVREELGIAHEVRHELYKLLVYEKGSFFAPHRDTEKQEGMFATLVVSLPSSHEGGALVVTHDGESRRIELGGGDARFQVRYAAFYADCQHEVLPVRRGFRVCAIYNLSIARKRQPVAPRSASAVATAARLLAGLFEDPSRDKVAIALKHQYSEAALEPGALKGGDRARYSVLARVAEQLDYELFLALMTRHQSGAADDESLYDNRSRPRGRYDFDQDDDDNDDFDDPGDGEGAEFAALDEDSLTLDHWRDRKGAKVPRGTMRLVESEVVSDLPPGEWPSRTEIHEATGNEGVSMDRWYRQAVVVLWPKDRAFRILAREGPWTALPALEELVKAAPEPEEDPRCRAFAEAILDCWPASGSSRWWTESKGKTSAAGRMLRQLARIGSVDLAARFVSDILPNDLDGTEGPALVQLGGKLGWTPLLEPLRAVFARQAPDRQHRAVAAPAALFAALCGSGRKTTSERRTLCVQLAGDMESVLDRFDHPPKGVWRPAEKDLAGIVANLFHAFAAIGDLDRLDRLASRLLANPGRYDLHAVLIPAVTALARAASERSPARPAWTRLHESCVSRLRVLTEARPEPPRDFSREAAVACRCADCGELNAFLRDPEAEVHLFPRRKDLRQHLHVQIDRHQCDLTHETIRKGSPQTLVCTKTRKSFERRLAQFEVDTNHLRELEHARRFSPHPPRDERNSGRSSQKDEGKG